MSKSALAYVIAVIAVAATFASAHFPAPALGPIAASDWIGIATFVAAGVLLQTIAINFATGKGGASSIAFIPMFATAILFPPAVSLINAAIVMGFSGFFARIGPVKTLFNIAQVSIALGLGAHVYVYVNDAFQRTWGHAPAVNLI